MARSGGARKIVMNRIGVYLIYILAALLMGRILQYSWVTDDAFITFRSVINFVAGDGPVFNIGERVQSFTHPLWFLLLSFGGWLDLNLYFFSILLGLVFSLLTIFALFMLNKQLNGDNVASLVLVYGVLAASESFVSFGTSGLENSLTYFLVVATIIASLDFSKRLIFYSFVSLALLNRLDVIFILFPLVIYVTYKDWRDHNLRLKKLIIGFLPLIIWHLFSIVYYGFLFPNTKYAKVGGRSFVDNAESGFFYLVDSLLAEWHVFLLLAILPFLFFLALRTRQISATNKNILFTLISGVYLQVLYVVFISGGDFMRGRFFTVVVLVSSVSLLFYRLSVARHTKILIFASCYSLFACSAWIGAKESLLWMAPGVANERNFYKHTLGLNLKPENNYTNHIWAQQARELADSSVGIVGVNGQRAYWVPRHIKLIDPAALTDAFIARSPILDDSRTGHFTHIIPQEYLIIKTQFHDIPVWEDKDAQKLYENIKIVTESPKLFSVERMKSMFWLWTRYGL